MQLGSQRAMLENPKLTKTYDVRPVAPDILLLGNVGFAQARELTDRQAKSLVQDIGADGLCIHLNAAMELFQPEGERDFRGGLQTIRRFADLFGERLVVKETGCGISREVGLRLVEAGVRCIDVSGAGGTSWVRVEQQRSSETGPFAEWGIPTAACLYELRRLSVSPGGSSLPPRRCVLIASGGLRTGLDFAKAIALGASLGSAALPFLRAQQGRLSKPFGSRSSTRGKEGIIAYAQTLIRDLRAACVLTGARTLADLAHAPTVITGRLRDWIEQRT
jgi:isopentenyl-diphosphate delta-isomerase